MCKSELKILWAAVISICFLRLGMCYYVVQLLLSAYNKHC